MNAIALVPEVTENITKAQIDAVTAELCVPRAVANRSPSAAGLATGQSQLQMIKSLASFTIFAVLGASVIALPAFAPPVKADEVVAFAKADRLASYPVASHAVAGNCAGQIWPNIASTCLRNAESGATVREARLVTARR